MSANSKVMVHSGKWMPAVVGTIVKELKSTVDVSFLRDGQPNEFRFIKATGEMYGDTLRRSALGYRIQFFGVAIDVEAEVERFNEVVAARNAAKREEQRLAQEVENARYTQATDLLAKCLKSNLQTSVGPLHLVNYGGDDAIAPFAIVIARSGESSRQGQYYWSVVSYTNRDKGGSGSTSAPSWEAAAIEYFVNWIVR